jgi:hypothetical protein
MWIQLMVPLPCVTEPSICHCYATQRDWLNYASHIYQQPTFPILNTSIFPCS